MKFPITLLVISLILIAAVVGLIIYGPISQDPLYHSFSDTKKFFWVNNFNNVASNIVFLIVGLGGINQVLTAKLVLIDEFKSAYLLLFLGIFLTALGSTYYHLWPTNQTLAWDRAPMTIAIMSLFSIVIAEFVSLKVARIAIWPLIGLGLFSVIYWIISEVNGQGDLRLYVLVQFVPILLTSFILLGYQSRFSNARVYWWLLLCYAVAKLCEHFDAQIHQILLLISGHTLKHIIAAFGLGLLLLAYKRRIDYSGK